MINLLPYAFSVMAILIAQVLPGVAVADHPEIPDPLTTHTVTCADCPDSVATIVTMGFFGQNFCRGVLIKNGRVLTAAYCVAEYQQDCTKDFKVQIDKKHYSCQAITAMQITENDTGQPDIAVIQLSEIPKVRPSRLAFRPFDDEMAFHYFNSKYDFSKNASSMERVECRAKMYSSALGDFVSPLPRVLALGECPFGAGDSGSPIFNDSGSVVAILQGGLGQEALEDLDQVHLPGFEGKSYLDLLKANFHFRESSSPELSPVIAATTLACFPPAGGKVCHSPTYVEFATDELSKIKADFADHVRAFDAALKVKWGQIPDQPFQELLESKHPKNYGMADFHKTVRPAPVCGRAHGLDLVPTLQITVKVDRYFRIYYEHEVTLERYQADGDLPACGD